MCTIYNLWIYWLVWLFRCLSLLQSTALCLPSHKMTTTQRIKKTQFFSFLRFYLNGSKEKVYFYHVKKYIYFNGSYIKTISPLNNALTNICTGKKSYLGDISKQMIKQWGHWNRKFDYFTTSTEITYKAAINVHFPIL